MAGNLFLVLGAPTKHMAIKLIIMCAWLATYCTCRPHAQQRRGRPHISLRYYPDRDRHRRCHAAAGSKGQVSDLSDLGGLGGLDPVPGYVYALNKFVVRPPLYKIVFRPRETKS